MNARFNLVDRTLVLTSRRPGRGPQSFLLLPAGRQHRRGEIKIFVDKDSILIGEGKLAIAKQGTRAEITSLQYFSASEYNKYQNIATYNPLNVIRAVAEREGRVLDGESLARKIDPKFSVESVQTLYFDMVRDGFIDFDIDTKAVKVHDKLFHFVNAAQGKDDFDNLAVVSDTKETNATLDTRTGDMLVDGVEEPRVESQAARGPRARLANQMVMGADRSINFRRDALRGLRRDGGQRLRPTSTRRNEVKLDSVRYLDIFVPQPKPEGATDAPEPIGIASRIEHVSGSCPRRCAGEQKRPRGHRDIPESPDRQAVLTSSTTSRATSTRRTRETVSTSSSTRFRSTPSTTSPTKTCALRVPCKRQHLPALQRVGLHPRGGPQPRATK